MEDDQCGRAGCRYPGEKIHQHQQQPDVFPEEETTSHHQQHYYIQAASVITTTSGSHVTVPLVLLVFLTALAGVCSAFCPQPCSCDKEFTTASCEGGTLDVIPYQLNPHIESISLSGNRISKVRYELNSYHSLLYLDLSYNRIQHLNKEEFSVQTKLISLNLSNNEIRELNQHTFHALRSLQVLNLSNNQLEFIHKELFENQEKLWELYLSNNRINYIDDDAFKKMVNLRILSLENNSLTSVPTSNLQTLLSLRELRLGGNFVEYVGDYAFPILKEMLLLSLDGNSISEIHSTAFNGLHALKFLDLRNNNLTEVPTSQLSKLASLVELDLSGNYFQAIGPVAFQSLFYLQRLWLSRQPELRFIDPRAFVDNTHLEGVVMDENPLLSSIPQKLFHNNPLIQNIWLRDNAILTLSSAHFPLKSLQTLYLSGNPLICNCSLLWLWRQVHQVNTTPRIDEVTCGGPPSVEGFYVADVPESEVLCETPWMAVLMVTVCVMALFALTCGVLFFFGTGKVCFKQQPTETLTQNGTVKDPAAFQHTITTWDTAKQLDDSYENDYMDVSMISTKSAPIVYV